jgi:hypothetical protein
MTLFIPAEITRHSEKPGQNPACMYLEEQVDVHVPTIRNARMKCNTGFVKEGVHILLTSNSNNL